MNIKNSLLALTFLASQASAGTPMMQAPTLVEAEESLLSGSISAAYASLCNGRGIVATHSVAEGDSAVGAILTLKRPFAKESKWSYNGLYAYYATVSGHTLYGKNSFGSHMGPYAGYPIPESNIENETVVYNELRYSFTDEFSMGLGHNFIHGGLFGVMAKHWADSPNSAVNEFVLTPEYSPYPWLTFSANVRYSFQGITGWWFEPSVAFKAPLIGTAEDVKLAAVLSFNMSVSADYYEPSYCNSTNGAQAFWIKLATPYYVTEDKNVVLTPSISFNWAGAGTESANERSAYAKYSGNSSFTPFRDFGIVASVYLTYKF